MPEKNKVKKLSTLELAAYFESLSMLLKAGIPANECPGIIGEDMASGSLASVCRALERLLSGGKVYILSEAMEQSGAFPVYATEMVRLGETSGRLETTAGMLGRYYQRQDALLKNLHGAVRGPLLLLVIMSAVLVFLILFVLPVFEQVFLSLGAAPEGGLGSAFAAARIAIVLLGILIVLLLAVALLYILPSTRAKMVQAAAHLPVAGRISYLMSAGRFTHALAMLLASGIPVEEALDKATPLATSRRIIQSMPAVRAAVAEGTDLGRALVDSGALVGFEAKVLLSAARAGQTSNVMENLAEYYTDQADNQIDSLLGVVEPAFVGLLSIATGVIMLSVMLPLTSIMSAIR